MSDPRKYSDAEVRAIIDRALSTTSSSADGLSHGDLLSVGAQVGLSADAMTRAAEEVRAAALDSAATRAVASRRRRWLAAHAGLYALINGLLFAVNFLTTPGQWWSLFPIVLWGLALVLHAAAAFLAPISKAAIVKERRRVASDESMATQRMRVAVPESAAERPAAVDEHAAPDRAARRA